MIRSPSSSFISSLWKTENGNLVLTQRPERDVVGLGRSVWEHEIHGLVMGADLVIYLLKQHSSTWGNLIISQLMHSYLQDDYGCFSSFYLFFNPQCYLGPTHPFMITPSSKRPWHLEKTLRSLHSSKFLSIRDVPCCHISR